MKRYLIAELMLDRIAWVTFQSKDLKGMQNENEDIAVEHWGWNCKSAMAIYDTQYELENFMALQDEFMKREMK